MKGELLLFLDCTTDLYIYIYIYISFVIALLHIDRIIISCCCFLDSDLGLGSAKV